MEQVNMFLHLVLSAKQLTRIPKKRLKMVWIVHSGNFIYFASRYGTYLDNINFAASLLPQPETAFQASSCVLEPGYAPRADSSSVLRNSNTSGTMSSWAHSSVHPRIAHMTKGREYHGHVFHNTVHLFLHLCSNLKKGTLDKMLIYFSVQKI